MEYYKSFLRKWKNLLLETKLTAGGSYFFEFMDGGRCLIEKDLSLKKSGISYLNSNLLNDFEIELNCILDLKIRKKFIKDLVVCYAG